MRFKLHHPLWIHLPALACIAITVKMLLSVKLPAVVPIHFGRDGRPDRWGSPLETWLIMVGIPLLLVIGSGFLDEQHARHEPERRFSWAGLLDELAVGFLTGIFVKTIPQLAVPEPVLSGQLQMAYWFTVGAVLVAALLELLRPHRPGEPAEQVDVSSLAQDIQAQIQPSVRWLYWEKHNTLWWRCISVAITVFWIGAAADFAAKSDYGGVVLTIFMAMLFASGYGGFRVAVTPGRLRIRSWSMGLTFLRLRLENVRSVEVMRFDALADFMGWGLYRYSFSLRAWGFVLGGNQGVMIEMKNGRKFFISSKTPEKLAAATEAGRIAAPNRQADLKR